MARRIGNTPFLDLLPENLASDPTIRAAAAALDGELRHSVLAIPDLLLFSRLALSASDELIAPLARLTELVGGLPALPESTIDALAWQLHVDGYEAAVTYDDKRRMVDRSLLLHRRKGTPWAVAEALRVLGYADAVISEGAGVCAHDSEISHNGSETYSSGNRWALFDVEVDLGDGMGVSVASIQRLRAAVEAWKNVRSHLRSLRWRATLEDGVELSDSADTGVQTDMDDLFFWGMPVHNGQIRYDNGLFRAYDGSLAHDGLSFHSPWEARGWLHDNLRDPLSIRLSASQDDAVRFWPHYDASAMHDGAILHGQGDTCALERADLTLHTQLTENLFFSEQLATAVTTESGESIGRYHDGSFSHGQSSLFIHNGVRFYDGSLPHGQWGGMDVRAVRYDRVAVHNGEAVHNLWGWQQSSAHRPAITYQTLSDFCTVQAGMAAEDHFALNDEADLTLRRYKLRFGAFLYDNSQRHDYQEEHYAL